MMKRAMSAVCVCVPMSAMAEPAQLSGQDLGEMLPGATIQIDAPLGYKLPVRYAADGTISGEAGELASYLGSATDTGRWWIKGDQVCVRWARWLDRQSKCLRLRRDGRVLHWTDLDGSTGTATLIVEAPPRPAPGSQPAQVVTAAQATPTMPRIISAAPAIKEPDLQQLGAPPSPGGETLPTFAPPPPQRVAAVPASSLQTAAGVRNLASPPLTGSQQPLAMFAVTNVSADDVLNVRSGPSTEFEIVAALKPGSRGVAITGDCQSDWCPVRHQAGAGWVNRQYLASDPVPVMEASMRLPARESAPAATPAKSPFAAGRDSPEAPRTCLTASARALLQTIESKFGPVKVVSTCRAGATIAGTGRMSRHASGNAVDFSAGARKGEILRWLIANHKAGGTMTYPDMDHIHVDIGPHFVSIAGGQNSASWRGSRGERSTARDDDD